MHVEVRTVCYDDHLVVFGVDVVEEGGYVAPLVAGGLDVGLKLEKHGDEAGPEFGVGAAVKVLAEVVVDARVELDARGVVDAVVAWDWEHGPAALDDDAARRIHETDADGRNPGVEISGCGLRVDRENVCCRHVCDCKMTL